jgi:drug/metabolite transporter (DMT)-like permease
LVLVSAPNWAIFSTLSRRGLKTTPATLMVFFVTGFGWLFTTILFALGPGFADVARLPADGWLAVIALGIFATGLAYIFWYDGLRVLSVAKAGAFVYLEPFVTVVAAALILAEPLLFVSLLGGAAILGGVWLVNRK